VIPKENIADLKAVFLFNFTKLSIHALGSNVNHTLLFVSGRQKQLFYFYTVFSLPRLKKTMTFTLQNSAAGAAKKKPLAGHCRQRLHISS